MAADRVPPLAHPAEGAAVLDGRQMSCHEIGTEAEEVAALGHVVPGELGPAEVPAGRRAEPAGAEEIEGEMVGRAEGPHETGREARQGPPQRRRQQGEALGGPFPLQGRELAGEEREPLLPGNRREGPRAARPAPLEGVRHPVGVVELLHDRLSPGAELSPVDRMGGVPLDFPRPSL
jgi:hypothetical protein